MEKRTVDLKLARSHAAETWMGRWQREHPHVVLFWSVRGSAINAMFGDPAACQKCRDDARTANFF